MTFQSKNIVNGIPEWTLDTDTQTILHIDPVTEQTERFSFHTDHIEAHLRYAAEHRTERLQNLVDSGKIYSYLNELDLKITDAIIAQTDLFMEKSREYQIAVKVGDLYRAGALGNALREQAKEAIYPAMVYV